jgi:hypothetical protein
MNAEKENQVPAFVSCIEAGSLEAMAVRLLKSLRTSGGRLSSAEFIAVKPRFGPALRKQTLNDFRALDGLLLNSQRENRFPWTPFFGKPLALIAAENVSKAGTFCFLDSDILFTSEPDELLLSEGVDFAACPAFDSASSSTGAGKANDAFWQMACASGGLALDDLPWLSSSMTHEPIRMHFNAGVMVYRRTSRFAEEWLETFTRILLSKFAHPDWGVHTADEVAAAVAVRKLDLKWRELAISHNHSINSWTARGYQPEPMRSAALLHYHTAMNPANWVRFLESLAIAHPSTYEWMRTLGPIQEGSFRTRIMRYLLRTSRAAWRWTVLRRCCKVGV